jgi:hypothetical protein
MLTSCAEIDPVNFQDQASILPIYRDIFELLKAATSNGLADQTKEDET